MRREHEWLEFLERLALDRKRRVVSGEGEHVSPRQEIMIPTPERQATTVKKDVDVRVKEQVLLRSAEYILDYKPIDVVSQIAPRALLIIAVDDDATTPTDHATALYEAASAPKKLIMQRHTTHYAAYEQYGDQIAPEIVGWFTKYLDRNALEVHAQEGDST
jgi:hypothetical protein